MWLLVLDEEWSAGCCEGAELWRRLRSRWFAGSLRVVTEWTTDVGERSEPPTGSSGFQPMTPALLRRANGSQCLGWADEKMQ